MPRLCHPAEGRRQEEIVQVTYNVGPRPKNRIPLKKAMSLAEKIYDRLLPLCDYITVAGSIRRQRPEIGDIEFVVLPKNLKSFLAFLDSQGYFGGNRKRTAIIKNLKIEIYIAHKPEEVGAMLFTYTGDYLFNIAMRSIAKRRGWKLDQYGLQDAETGEWILQSPYEEDFFGALGVDYHTPEERSFAHRPKDRHASMGTIGPRDWSPRREIPGHESKFSQALDRLDWKADEWRDPDYRDDFSWVWYGPGGKEGDHATELEWLGGGWNVSEYAGVGGEASPYGLDILKTTTFIGNIFLSDALWRAKGISITPEAIDEDPDEWGKFAVSLGIAYLAYFGGNEEWVESLP